MVTAAKRSPAASTTRPSTRLSTCWREVQRGGEGPAHPDGGRRREPEFEKAAALRDRLRAITLLGKRQKVVAGFLADTDVLGLYVGTVRSVVAVLHFQGGELAGRDLEVFPTAGEPVEEILSAFLVQYYSPRGILPRQILLPENLEGAADLARLLSHQAGRKVDLVTPQRGAKADLIRMAQENAKTECERLTTRAERTAKVLTLLAELLGLPEPPGRIEAYDISNTGASDIVAAMTVFEEGSPRKGRTATSSSGTSPARMTMPPWSR